jgi:hypothetical protein
VNDEDEKNGIKKYYDIDKNYIDKKLKKELKKVKHNIDEINQKILELEDPSFIEAVYKVESHAAGTYRYDFTNNDVHYFVKNRIDEIQCLLETALKWENIKLECITNRLNCNNETLESKRIELLEKGIYLN